jgi:uncharacterized protein (DUF934 family)
MALLEAGRLVADPWTRAEDGAPLPDGPAIVGLARLLAEAPSLAARGLPLGVALPNDADPAVLAPHLDRLALVVLRFPRHRDGRAFTQARALRERHGFLGRIRAAGHVLADQHQFLLRCGVDSIELPDGADIAAWERARALIPTAYQAAVAGDMALGQLRRRIALG